MLFFFLVVSFVKQHEKLVRIHCDNKWKRTVALLMLEAGIEPFLLIGLCIALLNNDLLSFGNFK